MAEDKKCTACKGDGGHWETGNGEKFENRRWVSCPACNGTGRA